ncbi:MAG: hypothetical protein KatS3mg064_2398 [Tepidiforma sp.]|jgi:hypothetical protein|nr:MAG: hypothetical protein KatS3mg064_2398 [Tepidiforma sp.]
MKVIAALLVASGFAWLVALLSDASELLAPASPD